MKPAAFHEIDWNAMWQEASGHSNWEKSSSQALWDKRAASFARRINRVREGEPRDKDDYITKMLNRIEIKPDWTVLDIGCGPGTLTIPLAQKAKSVTGLDISGEMLKRLETNAVNSGLKNILYLNEAWQDAFMNGNLGNYDVVVASRSMMSGDMKLALSSVIRMARKAAYLTFPVVHQPLDFEVYRAIGRENRKHPPYIYILNLLFQMGIQANVEILHSKVKVQYANIEEVLTALQMRTDPFSPDEKEKARDYLARIFAGQSDSTEFTHEGESQWALIWWKTAG